MHQTLVHVVADFAADSFKALMRIKTGHVVELLRHNQNVLTSSSDSRQNARIGQEGNGSRTRQKTTS